MKKILVLSVAVLFAFTVSAQKFGVKAGYGMSGYLINYYSPDGSVMSKGFNAGLVAELDLKVIGVRADLTFQQMGSDYDSRNDEQAYRDSAGYDAYGFEVDYKQAINYLNLGVSVKKGFGPVYVFAGPYFGFALKGNKTTKFTPSTGSVQEWTVDIFSDPNTDYNPAEPFSDDNNLGGNGDLYNKLDIGANLGLGASFSGFFVEANAGYGFLNFINHDSEYYSGPDTYPDNVERDPISGDAKSHNIFFGLSVGYMLGK